MDAKNKDTVTIMSASELAMMRVACKAAAEMVDYMGTFVKAGVTTQELDDIAVAWTKERGYKNGPLNYHGFPKSICTSVNEVVCHGIPTKKLALKDGDIINIDVTPIVDGFFGDTSKTFFVGKPSPTAKKLVEVTEECLKRGIAAVKHGSRIGDIGKAIQTYAEAEGFSVVRDFVGHGIGRALHEAPQVPNYGQPGSGLKLRPGMVLAVEPAVTRDRKLSAQFEHTILVTDTGAEILTVH
jgi:methionyl aminopeptidase